MRTVSKVIFTLAAVLVLGACNSAQKGDDCTEDADCGPMKCINVSVGSSSTSCKTEEKTTCDWVCQTDADCKDATFGSMPLPKCGSDCAGTRVCVPADL